MTTLNLYILRRHLMSIGLVLFVAFLLVMVGELVEITGDDPAPGAAAPPIVTMVLLKAPSVLSDALPFVVLLGTLSMFLRLARNSELVITRAAGLSVWRVLRAPLIGAVGLGIFAFAVWNPIASSTLARYEVLDARFYDGEESQLSLSAEGLWLRQSSPEGQTVINASRASADGEELIGVQVFEFDPEGGLLRRISARRADLADGAWQIQRARIWDLSDDGAFSMVRGRDVDRIDIPTDLTSSRILESFADPREISFWELGDFIETLEASGFSSVRHRLYLQTELARPLMFVAMVLIAAGFSMRHVRFGSIGVRVLMCVISGFAIFFLSDFTQALGSAGTIPVPVAAWVPPAAALLLATSLLLHLEDG